MNIIIHPYGARLWSGIPNAKNFPHWQQVVDGLNTFGCGVVQIGVKGEERINGVGQFVIGWPLKKLRNLIEDAETFVAVDSFLPHFVHVECGRKRGVVIWGKSNPALWGHPENINLLRDPKYLRPFQFASWNDEPFNAEVFVPASDVIDAVCTLVPSLSIENKCIVKSISAAVVES